MKNITLLSCLLCAVTFLSCDGDLNCSPATGEVIEEELELDSFSKLSLEISGNVFITKGSDQRVTVTAQSSIVELLRQTSVTDNTWIIGDFDSCITTDEGIVINVTVPMLTAVSVSGSGNVVVQDSFSQNSVLLTASGSGSIDGRFETTNMECTVSGSGGISVEGTTQELEVSISGSGSVAAFALPSETCQAIVSGSGDASVNVRDVLDVLISGSGSVSYKGNPTINSTISGSGSVNNANPS